MKQVIQNMKSGKTTVEEIPVPVPGAGQALVRVAASLVSAGTERMVVEFAERSLLGKAASRPDLVRQVINKMKREGVLPALSAAFNRLDQPLALGYSSAGTIVALGEGMTGFQVGDRVACAGGNYAVHAEYNLIPRNLLTRLPVDVDLEAAAFTTLAAIAMHGFRLAETQISESVAVIGAGLLGLLAGQIAAAAGCAVLCIDTDPQRVALAGTLGLTAVQRAEAEERARAFTAGRGFDAILICADTASNDPIELAAVIARDRGRVVATGAVGLDFPRKPYYEKELSFINSRSYGPGRYDPEYEDKGRDYPLGYVRWTEGRNFEAVVALLAAGKLSVQPLISHRFPIGAAPDAYRLITGKKEPFLGILLTYPPGEGVEGPRLLPVTARSSAVGAPVRLGVIGAGLYANATLLPAIRRIPSVARVAIASAGGLHAREAARKFGFENAAADADALLEDERINTIAILTRHDSHTDLALRALQAGRHVFVEKPLAISVGQLDAIEACLEEAGRGLLLAGFNRRFAPLAGGLAEFLAGRTEPLTMHYRVNAGFIPASHWVHDPIVGGGRIVGEGCHFIDFLTFLAGAAPRSVHATALPDQGRYNQDNVSMTLTFADGSLGVVDYLANGDKSYPKERLEVFCGGRIAVLDDFRALELVRDGRRRVLKGVQDKGWHAEWLAFSRAIESGGQPPIPYAQMFGVTRATFAVLDSLRSGETVTL